MVTAKPPGGRSVNISELSSINGFPVSLASNVLRLTLKYGHIASLRNDRENRWLERSSKLSPPCLQQGSTRMSYFADSLQLCGWSITTGLHLDVV